MRKFAFLFAVFILPLAWGNAQTLTTTAELRALTEDQAREGRSFDLTAQIISKTPGITGCAFTVWDGTGGLSVKAEDNPESFSYDPGDIIRWQGATMVNEDREPCFDARLTKLLGHRPLPSVIAADPRLIPSGTYNFRRIRLTGLVSDTFRDEIDPCNLYLILQTDGCTVYAATQDKSLTATDIPGLVNAEVEIIGTCMPAHNGHRIFLGPRLQVAGKSDISILRAPPTDPFAVPLLEDIHHVRASDITKLGRRKTAGYVTATWQRHNLMLQSDAGINLRVKLSDDNALPSVGDRIEVVGTPETDLFHLNFTRASWKRLCAASPTANTDAQDISAKLLLFNEQGERKYKPQHQGMLFRLEGTVRSLPPDDDPSARMMLECDGNLIPVDASSCTDALSGLSPNSKVAVVGVCVLEIQNWSPNTVFPRIEGLSLVIRRPSDIVVLSRPPWWTPARLLIVIGSLLAALVGIVIWNRILNRIVERRSRQLLREQIAHAGDKLKVGERTRLAVELHDSLSQTLTGVSFQIDAAEQARQKDPSQIKRYLDVARQTLKSCREELRNCLWDLRNNALEEANAEVAIRQTVEPQISDAELTVNFSVPRQKLTDNTFHAILRIVRELAVNGVRHGGATHIAINGRIDGGRLVISVTDDGCGFDPKRHPGVDEGHFGLLGVRERIEDLDGALTIDSAPGRGSRITIELTL